MRTTRPLAAAATALAASLAASLAISLAISLGALPAAAEETPTPAPAPAAPTLPAQAAPQAVLATAERVLEGDAAPVDPDPTLALLELRRALPRLAGTDRAEARAILARPAYNPTGNPTGEPSDGYTSPTERVCDREVCVHYVSAERHPDDRDAATAAQVALTQDVLAQVWATVVGRLGYTAPRADRGRGGDDRLDVYLDHLPRGIYGYCVAEGHRRRAPGYCVLDDDYAGYAGSPEVSLRATAAHEFFHAVQYAYDSYEDAWLMESTATWAEERVFDDADDNRQYLRAGQLHRSRVPLDTFETSGAAHYGNWVFWEYLTARFGADEVRDVWERAVGRREHSVEALTRALGGRRAMQRTYAAFAGANTDPASAYPEGAAYDRPRPHRRSRLGRGDRRASRSFRLDHLSSATWRLRPRASLGGRRWRLWIDVAGPSRRTSPEVVVTVRHRDGRVGHERVRLDRSGDGRIRVRFGDVQVRDVSVTPVNASTRRPEDDGLRFEIAAKAHRLRR